MLVPANLSQPGQKAHGSVGASSNEFKLTNSVGPPVVLVVLEAVGKLEFLIHFLFLKVAKVAIVIK